VDGWVDGWNLAPFFPVCSPPGPTSSTCLSVAVLQPPASCVLRTAPSTPLPVLHTHSRSSHASPLLHWLCTASFPSSETISRIPSLLRPPSPDPQALCITGSNKPLHHSNTIAYNKPFASQGTISRIPSHPCCVHHPLTLKPFASQGRSSTSTPAAAPPAPAAELRQPQARPACPPALYAHPPAPANEHTSTHQHPGSVCTWAHEHAPAALHGGITQLRACTHSSQCSALAARACAWCLCRERLHLGT